MKAVVALTLTLATGLAACTRVIERPAASPSVVTTPAISERVVERPGGQAAAGSSVAACTWASQSYSHGGLSCQQNSQFRCNNGSWERTAQSC